MNSNPQFPISEVLPQIAAILDSGTRLVLEAPPGAGKTTQVPLALLDATWLARRKIVMLEPRRIAARAAAEFMAVQLGEKVGESVGYRIRFESRISARTRIEVVTEGILTRLIQSDPELADVGAILFDEFHERHLHGDLGAALALDVQASLRPDLRLLIMSATLDGERVARWFDAPRLSSAGRSFPVRIEYPSARPREAWPIHLRRVVETALADNDGDVLVFLPGRREIERAGQILCPIAGDGAAGGVREQRPDEIRTSRIDESFSPHNNPVPQVELGREGADALPGAASIQLLPLHGELSLAQQHAALKPAAPGTRRIILATNVAESSLTLPGIRAVIDLGLAREPRFDPNSGFSRLETVAISQASADQRSGRAGRVAAGVAYRLWPQSRRLEPSRRAEIGQVELSGLAQELAAWGSAELRWLDAPPPGTLASARELLRMLGAVDADSRLTRFGRRLQTSGASPRLASAVLRAPQQLRALACDLIALVEARNPLRGESARSDDFRQRHSALAAYRNAGNHVPGASADRAALAAIDHAATAWCRRFEVRRESGDGRRPGPRRRQPDPSLEAVDPMAFGEILMFAFPDRIARQDDNDPRRYRLSNGRGAHLHQNTQLYGEPWLVVPDLRFDAGDSLILSAVPLSADAFERNFSGQFVHVRRVRWNRETRAVEAFEEYGFAQLVLQRRQVPANKDDALPALLAAVRELGLDVLPWSENAIGLRQRINCLREWRPDLRLPDFCDASLLATLEDWLAPYLVGKTRLESLSTQSLGEALGSMLDYAQRRSVDELAPETIRVPSGNNRRLRYDAGKPPVLAVKLQELFGLADTPRIADGRIAVVLHLLSPAQRPIQITQDLRGFWENTYPEVKKQLKGRYPRHPWPDDPWSATPTHSAKRRPS